ncbi:HlyD family secretion protein [Glaciecola sp. 1036]|uniref:HlyD family secretion protein n=1 Tax=Alteromonadaceae TaxID=72275 RepID=UPI003CFE373A
MQQNPLFRQQAWQAQFQKDYGKSLLMPTAVHWWSISILLAIVAGILIFISTVKFAKTQNVQGWIVKDNTFRALATENNSQIAEYNVASGQAVVKGQPLMRLNRNNEFVESQQLKLKNWEILNNKLQTDYHESVEDIQRQIQDAKARNKNLKTQQQLLKSQQQLVQSSADKLHARLLASELLESKGSISQDSVIRLEIEHSDFLITINRLQIQIQDVQNRIETTENLLFALEEELLHLGKAHQISIDELLNQKATITTQTHYVLRAPVDGKIDSILYEVGETVHSGQALIRIQQSTGLAKAILTIPSNIGGKSFTANQVTMRIDAFPYQEFGLVQGQISKIEGTLSSHTDITNPPIQLAPAFYIAHVDLTTQQTASDTSNLSLRDGMTLQADLVIQQQTLLEWFLGPLLSLSDRR